MPTYRVHRMEQNESKTAQNPSNEFAEYMWMADLDLESFDNEVYNQFAEDDYIRSSIEMLLDEEERETVYFDESGTGYPQPAPEESYRVEPSNSYYPKPPQYPNDVGPNQSHGFENLALGSMPGQYEQRAPFHAPMNSQFTGNSFPNQMSQQQYVQTGQQQDLNGRAFVKHQNGAKSKLNPNATPFFLNADAKEFVPRDTNGR